MQYSQYLWVSLLSIGLVSPVFANSTDANAVEEGTVSEAAPKYPRLESLKELKNIKAKDLKVDANAAQPDEIKDPLQPLNRQIYALNDSVDRHVLFQFNIKLKFLKMSVALIVCSAKTWENHGMLLTRLHRVASPVQQKHWLA
jgi:phospholipid-binding lipoprotein MlaA